MVIRARYRTGTRPQSGTHVWSRLPRQLLGLSQLVGRMPLGSTVEGDRLHTGGEDFSTLTVGQDERHRKRERGNVMHDWLHMLGATQTAEAEAEITESRIRVATFYTLMGRNTVRTVGLNCQNAQDLSTYLGT